VQNETLQEGLDVISSGIPDLENRALRWYGHIERIKEEGLRKNVLHCSPPRRIRRETYI
jgi:hypothetical protein